MKPIIIGLSNPHSSDPRDALAPYPLSSSGHRLWKMANNISPSVGRVYCQVFDRRNLMDRVVEGVPAVPEIEEGATVLILGNEVLQCLNRNLPRSTRIKKILIHPQILNGITWRYIP